VTSRNVLLACGASMWKEAGNRRRRTAVCQLQAHAPHPKDEAATSWNGAPEDRDRVHKDISADILGRQCGKGRLRLAAHPMAVWSRTSMPGIPCGAGFLVAGSTPATRPMTLASRPMTLASRPMTLASRPVTLERHTQQPLDLAHDRLVLQGQGVSA
jgi:hypothetical protein